MNWLDPSVGVGAFAILLCWMAWRERSHDNTRDARLLAVLGVGTATGAAALAFLS